YGERAGSVVKVDVIPRVAGAIHKLYSRISYQFCCLFHVNRRAAGAAPTFFHRSSPSNDTRPRKPLRLAWAFVTPAWQKNAVLSKKAGFAPPVGKKDLAKPIQVIFR